MTVGIGLLCDGGKKILLCADMRGSYGGITQNDQTGKLFDLPFSFCGAIAGSVNWCEEIISELHHRISQIPEAEMGIERLREAIHESYFRIYVTLADEELRNALKISMEQYRYDDRLVPELRNAANDILQGIEIDVDLIVAGFFKGNPVQLVVHGGRSVTITAEVTPGNAAIGSGAAAAIFWLNYRKQNVMCGLARSLFHLTEAKQFSEVEPTVGPLRQIVLLGPDGFRGLEGGQELLQGWWDRYGLPSSDGLEHEQHGEALRKAFGLQS